MKTPFVKPKPKLKILKIQSLNRYLQVEKTILKTKSVLILALKQHFSKFVFPSTTYHFKIFS